MSIQNLKPFVSAESLITISQGALGAVTFGAYHQFTTNKIMELNNEKIEMKHKIDMAVYKAELDKQQTEIQELRNIITKQQSSHWW